MDSGSSSDASKPMLWIGIYIGVASLFCVLAMAADLFHGIRNRKLWLPSKYFTLNAASIMMITIAMKLPVDLNDPMPGWVDQFAKWSSMPFMSTMMANLMLSLASMDDKKLFENIIGLLMLVVTIAVNVFIQIQTHVLDRSLFIPYMYLGAMLYLLIVLTSLALTAPVSKHILEIKYQAAHKMASKDVYVQHTGISTVELMQCVRRYSIMAGTCSPQFVMATTPLCSAAGVICISSTITYLYYVISIVRDYGILLDFYSDYKWSMLLIFIIQSVGIVVGTIASFFRCFAPLSFKLSLMWCKKHTNIFKVERYWIQMLVKCKEIDFVFQLGSRALKTVVHNLIQFVLHVCIVLQKVIVVSCKTLALIPIGIVIIGVYCVHCWILLKEMFFDMPMVSNRDIIHELGINDLEDIQNYVLHLENDMELGTGTLDSMLKSVDLLIQKAEKQLPKNLLKLVEQSTGFGGLMNFDSDEVLPLLSVELPNSWSLPLLTLTCIAVTLPNICKDTVDSLFDGVYEGLLYTFLVEESLNNAGEGEKIQKATRILWLEVEVTQKWLGNTLQRNHFAEKTPLEILKCFSDKAEEMVVEINKNNNEEMLENSQHKLIAANSMYRITQTIMLNCKHNKHINEDELFAQLSDIIASIVVACLTNLPRVIAMKCHGSTIEERETSVRDAAKILGSTKKIIEKLQVHELPNLEPNKMAFIDEWRVYLKQSIP
ncbi:hypothetical protein E3N88_31282 [Mikania micrantha]|uniref:DUF4220 domain-containing protein n=1 Tax=Mikania micrantha TaxID=192012 RepID=A0A5N6MPK7_9ASTR|nr:hypothetical protein E3N88_31282 [Mikania micrantha]